MHKKSEFQSFVGFLLAFKNESPYLRGFHAFYFSPSGLNGAERTYAQAKRGVRSEALKVTRTLPRTLGLLHI